MTDLTKKERRERRIVTVTEVEIFRCTLYGAPFENCECGHGKRGSPSSPCPACGRPHDSVYTKPTTTEESEEDDA